MFHLSSAPARAAAAVLCAAPRPHQLGHRMLCCCCPRTPSAQLHTPTHRTQHRTKHVPRACAAGGLEGGGVRWPRWVRHAGNTAWRPPPAAGAGPAPGHEGLRALPDSIQQMAALQLLRLTSCDALTALPSHCQRASASLQRCTGCTSALRAARVLQARGGCAASERAGSCSGCRASPRCARLASWGARRWRACRGGTAPASTLSHPQRVLPGYMIT
jgi:hypothetical protein